MKKTLILISVALFASACQKESVLKVDGTYTGYFSFNSQSTTVTENLPVQLVISNTQFSSGDLNKFYSVGEGSVSVESNNLNFADFTAAPYYIKSGSGVVVSSVLLSGSYQYVVKGDSLFLTHTLAGSTSSYKLRKQ